MDEGVRFSRAEKYVRSLDPMPDRWVYDGKDIFLVYGSSIRTVPFGDEGPGKSEVFFGRV